MDADSGLKLLGHRYYDSSTGRFLTRDPIKDGRNWYSYCENSPVASIDPLGLLALVGAALNTPVGLAVCIGIAIIWAWMNLRRSGHEIDWPEVSSGSGGESLNQTPNAEDSPGGQPSGWPVGTGPTLAPPIGKQKEPDPMIPVFRVGGPDGRRLSLEDPRKNPNYYNDYGMRKDRNPGNVISGAFVKPSERGVTWTPGPTRSWEGLLLGNGKTEVEIPNPGTTVKSPWTHAWNGDFLRWMRPRTA